MKTTTASTTKTQPNLTNSFVSCGRSFAPLEIDTSKFNKMAQMASTGEVCHMTDVFEVASARKRRQVEDSFDYGSYDNPAKEYEDMRDDTQAQYRIVGGEEAMQQAIPYQVAIRMGTYYGGKLIMYSTSTSFCGGTLVAPEWVLTAAHCLHGSYRNLMVTAGHAVNYYAKAKEEPGFQESTVLSDYVHPQYRRLATWKGSDIALLKLKSRFAFTEYVQPACLPPAGFNHIHEHSTPVCLISGWGDEASGNRRGSSRLRYATIPLLSNDLCNELFESNNFPHGVPEHGAMCGGAVEGGIDTCQGDSGGPLTCHVAGHWTVTGVVSWGYGCGDRNSPGVYTSVFDYSDWIGQTIGDAETQSEPDFAPAGVDCTASLTPLSPVTPTNEAFVVTTQKSTVSQKQCGLHFEGIEFRRSVFYEMSLFDASGRIIGSDNWFPARVFLYILQVFFKRNFAFENMLCIF